MSSHTRYERLATKKDDADSDIFEVLSEAYASERFLTREEVIDQG